MSSHSISSRYATALLILANEKNIAETVAADMSLVLEALSKAADLRKLLSNPIIKKDKKFSIVEEVFKDKIGPDSIKFVKFVFDKDREDYLYAISKKYLEMRDKNLGIINVTIESSEELNSGQKEKLEGKLKEFTGKKVRMNFSLDKKLIGGFIVKIGDTVLDASIKRQLEILREKFASGDSALN